MKVCEGTSDVDKKTDIGMNMVADQTCSLKPATSDADCSHPSVIAITSTKLAEGQIKEEPAKLPNITSAMENESPAKKKTKLFDSEEIIMGQELNDNIM